MLHFEEGNKYMGRDILFKTEEFVFSYRVGGLLIKNDRILLQKPKNDDFAIIGGHVSCFETTAETLKREFEEELHAKIEVYPLELIPHILSDNNEIVHFISKEI